MNINLQLTYDNGTEKLISAQASDLVAFETKFDMSIARLEKEVKLTHFLFIAYSAEKRTKSTDLDFDAWVETVTQIEAKTPKK
jgi:hypothetical protein